jgi:hypothetical protein
MHSCIADIVTLLLLPAFRILLQYEQHAGCGSAKKWKASIRIEPGAVRECPRGANAMAFGKWLELKGIEAKGSKTGALL